MPDSPTDIVDPDLQSELDGLRLLVEETDESVIAFVRYRRVTEREAGVRYLKKHLALPIEERVLSGERQNPLSLLDNLPRERCCVQFYDLEDALPDITGYLNLNREAYAEVPHALVFWVGEYGLREVAQNAPDFWAWRSGVFDVRSDAPGLSQSVSQIALADDLKFTDRGDLERRARLYEGLIQEYEGKDEEHVARLRLKLFSVLHMLRDLERAGEAVREVMSYAERSEKKELAAHAYHSFGMIALEKGSLEESEQWYRKSAEIEEGLCNDERAAATYHELGRVLEKKGELGEAEEWYRKAKEVWENVSNENGAARTYHQLGVVAQKRGDLGEAEQWYRKAMKIWRRFDYQHGVAQTSHQLGMVAQHRRELDESERWYKKSAEIQNRLGDDYELAKTYYQLGRVSQERGEPEEAQQWYQKSAEITEDLGDEHGAAKTYDQRGRLARERGRLLDAGQWYLKAIQGFASANDSQGVRQATTDFVTTFDEASSDVQNDLRQEWIDARFSEDVLDDFLEQLD